MYVPITTSHVGRPFICLNFIWKKKKKKTTIFVGEGSATWSRGHWLKKKKKKKKGRVSPFNLFTCHLSCIVFKKWHIERLRHCRINLWAKWWNYTISTKKRGWNCSFLYVMCYLINYTYSIKQFSRCGRGCLCL